MTSVISPREQQELYEQDYYLWIEKTVEQIASQDFQHLDWQHIQEEIEALGIEQRRKVESYLKQLLIHLLLCRYWETEKERCQRGWYIEIANFRDELEFSFRSKTLYNYFLTCIDKVYAKARRQAIRKTELPATLLPEQCPFTVEEILDDEFLP